MDEHIVEGESIQSYQSWTIENQSKKALLDRNISLSHQLSIVHAMDAVFVEAYKAYMQVLSSCMPAYQVDPNEPIPRMQVMILSIVDFS